MRKKSIEEDSGTAPSVVSSNRLSRFLPGCKFPQCICEFHRFSCVFLEQFLTFFNICCSYSVPGIQWRCHQQRDPEAAGEGARHRGGRAQGRGVRRYPISFQPVSIQLLSLISRVCLCSVAGHPRCPNQRSAQHLQQRGEKITGGDLGHLKYCYTAIRFPYCSQ